MKSRKNALNALVLAGFMATTAFAGDNSGLFTIIGQALGGLKGVVQNSGFSVLSGVKNAGTGIKNAGIGTWNATKSVSNELFNETKNLFGLFAKATKRGSGVAGIGLGAYLGYSALSDIFNVAKKTLISIEQARQFSALMKAMQDGVEPVNLEELMPQLNLQDMTDPAQEASAATQDQNITAEQDELSNLNTTESTPYNKLALAKTVAATLLINPITKFVAKSVLCLICCKRGWNLLKTGTLSVAQAATK